MGFFSILAHAIIFLHFKSVLTLRNCSNFNGNTTKLIVHAHGVNTVRGFRSESVESINDPPPQYRQKVIQCVGPSPMELTVNTNHPEDFDIFQNLIQRNNVSTGFQYSTIALFGYFPQRLKHPVIFSCQPFTVKDECEKRYWEITPPNSLMPHPQFRETSTPSSPVFQALVQDMGFSEEPASTCQVVLILKQTDNSIISKLQYKWEPSSSSSSILKSTNSPTFLHGLYRHLPQNNHCVKILKEEEEVCENCEPYSDSRHPNAVIFYKNTSTTEYAFKGVFNISRTPNGPRKLYLEWDVPLNEMIHFEAPSVFYVNQTTQVFCSVSVLYFSYGTIITTQNETFAETPTDEKEDYKEDGRRVVSKNLTFLTGNKTETIYCRSPLLNFSKYEKSQKVSIEYPEIPRFIANETMDEIQTHEGYSGLSITCKVFGKPTPTISWTFPSDSVEKQLKILNSEGSNGMPISEILFPIMTDKFVGLYKCVAENYLGKVSKVVNVKISHEVSPTTKILIGSGVGVGALFCIIILLIMHRRIKTLREEYRTKTDEAIEEFMEGTKSTTINKSTPKHNSVILEQPYNDSFEVPFEKWVIDGKLLGEGQYGYVRKGGIQVGDKAQPVAVKMLKSSVEIEDFRGFLFELKIMAYIGNHPNVVRLVAACTQNIAQRNVMIGVEFCENGCLLEYIVKHRRVFQARMPLGDGGGWMTESLDEKGGTYENVDDSGKLTEEHLYIWSYQIANGMGFLQSKTILHGDLAARNVLLTADKTAKISDFGLSRVLHDSSNYTKESDVPLPWKYMAIESLKSMEFSSSSDVWSYGVTIWEIFSLGRIPFPEIDWSPAFIIKLEMGLRLDKPEKATDFTYDIMTSCWNQNPAERPKFSQLKAVFMRILSSLNSSFVISPTRESKISIKNLLPQPRSFSQVTRL